MKTLLFRNITSYMQENESNTGGISCSHETVYAETAGLRYHHE
jgi:hypothetical protein